MNDDATTVDPGACTAVNGVFMGGGARGIAYAGALKAMRERGLVFRSVAGASAGAITAALIAAGMGPEDIERAVPQALAHVRIPIPKPLAKLAIPKRLVQAALGHATSLFEARGLREWIDETLRTQIGKHTDGPVTFAELFAKEQIELYVVAMDLATGQPIVFCRRTTPDVEVAGAVASSSAIPGAFPGGRGVFGSADSGAVIHQLVDGGTWANYPAFVFQDRSFRAWLRRLEERERSTSDAEAAAWTDEGERPIVGFVLGDPEPQTEFHPRGFVPLAGPAITQRFDQGPTYTSASKPTFLFGAVLSSDWARFVLTLAIAVWVTLSVAVLPIAVRRFSTWAEWLPNWLYPFGLIGTMAVVALSIVIVMAVVSALVITSRLLADTLIPSAKALIGVPTDVPAWVGVGDDAVVIRVPTGHLETIGFDPADVAIQHAVAHAHRRVAEQLDDAESRRRLDAKWGDLAPPQVPELATVEPVGPIRRTSPTASLIVVLVSVVLTGGIAWWVTNAATTSGIWGILLAMFVAFVIVVGAILFLSARMGELAHRRSITCVDRPGRSGRIAAQVLAVTGVGLAVGAVVLSTIAMGDRDEHTVQATVVSGVDDILTDSRLNEYTMRLDGGETIDVTAPRHYRLKERVFVELSDARPGRGEIVGAVDDQRFVVVIVLWLLGLGVTTSAIRRLAWIRRCDHLGSLVDRWEAPVVRSP